MTKKPIDSEADVDAGVVDAVWGEIDGEGPDYRSLTWVEATVLQLKTQIGLGILGLPYALSVLGMVPGLIAIVVIALIVGCEWGDGGTWLTPGSDYVVGTFKLNHPEVYSIADAGYIIFGPIGREILGFAFWLLMVCVAGASFLSMSVAFNTITEHATCTIVWTVICMLIIGGLSSIQTLSKISWIGWAGLFSIMSAVITLMVAVGVTDRPSLAPAGDFHIKSPAFTTPGFVDSINAITIIIFAYGGTPNYFQIVGEMRDPRFYTRTIVIGQSLMTGVYLVVAAVVYHFAGQYIASPALGSAGHVVKKVCYGLALPGLAAGGVMIVHTSAKYELADSLRGVVSIPFFNDLLSLIGALLATLICMTLQWKLLMAMNVVFHIFGWFLSVAGTYAAVVVINDNFKNGNLSSCADNSGA
ncbi:hypothetical protein IAU60_004907 [Kwoniella sp. DSM 27419]